MKGDVVKWVELPKGTKVCPNCDAQTATLSNMEGPKELIVRTVCISCTERLKKLNERTAEKEWDKCVAATSELLGVGIPVDE